MLAAKMKRELQLPEIKVSERVLDSLRELAATNKDTWQADDAIGICDAQDCNPELDWHRYATIPLEVDSAPIGSVLALDNGGNGVTLWAKGYDGLQALLQHLEGSV
jgi:hypothetical protein